MPSVETIGRKQYAVYWESYEGEVDAYGRQVISPPVELKVRWEDTNRMGSDARGNPVSIDAEVIVDQDVTIGGVMWKGRMDDLPGTALVPEADVMKIVSLKRVPDVKGRHIRRIVSLSRHGDSLPPTS